MSQLSPPPPSSSPAPEAALEAGLAHHRAGRLEQAEAIYRRAVALNPRDADAVHLLGMLCHQTDRRDEAIALVGRAVELAPDVAHFRSNFAGVLGSSGRPLDALPHLRAAV